MSLCCQSLVNIVILSLSISNERGDRSPKISILSLQLALFKTLTGIYPFSTAGTFHNTHRYLPVLYSWHSLQHSQVFTRLNSWHSLQHLQVFTRSLQLALFTTLTGIYPFSTAGTLYYTHRYLPVLCSWHSLQHSQVCTRSLQLALFTTLTGIYPFSTAGTLYNTHRYLPVLYS